MNYIGMIIKGRYKIYDKVGSGGMASVYLARDLQTNEVVALKILKEDFVTEKKYVERFVREAETALKLKHENIAQVKDFGNENGIYYIVMEYVQGKTLEEIAEEKGKLPAEEVIKIGIEVAKALSFSLKHGVIAHRDIKPQNIMLTKDGKVKVMDFGVAKISSVSTITSQGSIIGTPYYISPEQAKGESADIRSDLYSLGITLYRLLTGKVPFDAENPWSIINMHITMPPPRIEKFKKGVSKPLEEIIYKLLEKNPNKRYQTPEELIDDLEKIETKKESPAETMILPQKNEQEETVIIPQEKTENKEETVLLNTASYETKQKNIKADAIAMLKNKKLVAILAVALVALIIPITIFALKGHSAPNNMNPPSVSINSGTSGRNGQQNGGITNPQTEYAELTVNSTPQGAEIFLNGKDTGFITPKTMRNLQSGNYTLTLKLKGFKDFSKNITLVKGRTLELSPKLEKAAETVNVTINSSPEGAKILIDGNDTEKITPATLDLKIGEHTLTLTLSGYKTMKQQITISKDKKSFNYTLQKIAAPIENGILKVFSTPENAAAYINGKFKGNTPLTLSLKKGKYKIVLKKEGYKSFSESIVMEAGKEKDINVQLEKIQYGYLKITSLPQGAEIFLNGKDSGKKTPYTFKLPKGKYTIMLKLKGYKVYTKVASVISGVTSIVNVQMEKNIELKTFTNDKKLYTLKYPKEWTLTEHPDEDTDAEIDSPDMEDGYQAACFIYTDDLKSENATTEEIINYSIEELKKEGLNIVKEEDVTIGKNKFHKIVYEGTEKEQNGKETNIKGAMFFTEKNGILFTIETDATPEDFSKAWSGFQIIIASFTAFP